MNQSYEEKIQDIISEVEVKTEVPNPYVTLSSGVVLKVKKVNYMIVQAVINRFHYPPIPESWDKDRGRFIQNPSHPDYLAAKAEIDGQRMMAVADAIAAFGVDINHIPPQLPKPESEGWLDDLELVGINVKRNSPAARQQAWINFVALPNAEDVARLTKEFLSVMGVSEGAVAEAIRENFPR